MIKNIVFYNNDTLNVLNIQQYWSKKGFINIKIAKSRLFSFLKSRVASDSINSVFIFGLRIGFGLRRGRPDAGNRIRTYNCSARRTLLSIHFYLYSEAFLTYLKNTRWRHYLASFYEIIYCLCYFYSI